jgi:hypothetical protein
MAFETSTEKVFKERVKVITQDLQYVDYGNDFVRFKLEDGGNVFEVSVKEIKPRKKYTWIEKNIVIC